MKHIILIVILVGSIIFSALTGSFIGFSQQCDEVCGEVLRLHIPANSDSAADQSVKLALRDFILAEYSTIFSSCESLDAAVEKAQATIPEIELAANDFLREQGVCYCAKAEIVSMYFSTREYERLILPAGEYTALRITLGTGNGHNWWCVIYPELCLPCVTKPSCSQSDVLNTFAKPQKLKVKFAIYELLQKMRG